VLAQGGIFHTHKYIINVKSLNDTIYLVPFGDIHYGAPLCATEKYQQFMDWGKGNPNVYYLGMGDYTDLASASERERLKSGLHDSTVDTLELMYMGLLEKFALTMEHTRGNLIGLIEGNHHYRFMDGTTSTNRLCNMMDTTYLGCTSFIRLVLKLNTMETSIDLFVNHGQGGSARLAGGSMNRVQYMAEMADADIYLMGHDHKRGVLPDTRLYLQDRKGALTVKERQVMYARTGSFLKCYVSGKGSYIVDTAKKPADLGGIKIGMRLRRPERKGKRTLSVDMESIV
jgi:predicted phosphodiesterase|tara:strand:- start:8965 stop:9822 length:858 start_codon:yes stop_codon:yes gene_type:complete